eukprot:100409-Prorocentrum_minimum.AAC.3
MQRLELNDLCCGVLGRRRGVSQVDLKTSKAASYRGQNADFLQRNKRPLEDGNIVRSLRGGAMIGRASACAAVLLALVVLGPGCTVRQAAGELVPGSRCRSERRQEVLRKSLRRYGSEL